MKYFKIENGVVTNNVVASQEFVDNQEGTFVQAQDEYGIGDLYDGSSFYKPKPVELTQSEAEKVARKWRDKELFSTDRIVSITDHPDHAATITYREALRNWPSTDDFPNNKPTL